MSRVRNADEFVILFRKMSEVYRRHFAPTIAMIRQKYVGKPEEDHINSSLEAHERVYLVNAFLAALNWRMDTSPEGSLPDLIPETPILSEERGSIRFLDYLGFERDTKHPLLIIETKRRSVPLPQAWSAATTYSEIVSNGLAGKRLKGKWTNWLNDLRDYVRSARARTGIVPRRVIITNAEWLILFLDPSDAFLEGGTYNPNRILVFRDRSEIEDRFSEVFRHLEHQLVLGETPLLTPGDLPSYICPDEVNRIMHGLRIKYIERQKLYEYPAPIISIAPAIFLRSHCGAWLRVEAPPREYELPHRNKDIAQHLITIRRVAQELLFEVNRQLGSSLNPFSLSKHYEDEESFAACPGVVKIGGDEYLVLTGDRTHYIMQRPSIYNCPYHSWDACNKAGVPHGSGPILARSTSPRSFFMSAEIYHCAHRDVGSAKANLISAGNRDRCGSRSGREGQAFCEIWNIEQYLCCGICAFEEICKRAAIFRLPCYLSRHRRWRNIAVSIYTWMSRKIMRVS